MRTSRRNIPDPVSPQNPLNQTDIPNNRVQDELEEKTSIENILREPDQNDKRKGNDTPTPDEELRKQTDVDQNVQDEAGL